MNDDAPSLTDVLEAAIRGALLGARVSLPGRIEAYDSDTRRATVQPLVMDGSINEDGERKTIAIAPITDVPVAFMGSGAIRIKMPVRVGDPCWLTFSSSALARWKSTDGRTVVDPGDDRRHHAADAIAIPLVTVGDGVEDEVMIEFTDDGLIRAGGDEPLVTRKEFLGHTHATAPLGPPTPPQVIAPPASEQLFPGTKKLRG